ncbi:hypothetical protein CRYUN_Cryun03dG0066900 [Craigia yunnanensis]
MKKVPGCSSIEVDSVVHEFPVSDKVHPRCKEIYDMLNEVDAVLEKAGFVPDTSEVLQDMDEEWKEGALSHHSKKLAIAFGLISTQPGTTIRIVKNLRVCGNCHSAKKLISKIFNREIIARDRNRFHHFKDGFCPCKDYWSDVINLHYIWEEFKGHIQIQVYKFCRCHSDTCTPDLLDRWN